MAIKKRSTAKKTKKRSKKRSKASALVLFNEKLLEAHVNKLIGDSEANKTQHAKFNARIERLEKKCK